MAYSNDELAYIQALVGQPWERDGLHCWALTIKVQQELFGRTLPLVLPRVPNPAKRREWLSRKAEDYGWTEVPYPRHGCVVRMHRPNTDIAHIDHVGVYFDYDGGLVLHSDDPHGVVLDSLVELQVIRNWKPRFFIPIE